MSTANFVGPRRQAELYNVITRAKDIKGVRAPYLTPYNSHDLPFLSVCDVRGLGEKREVYQ